jgi:VWFA-related protein
MQAMMSVAWQNGSGMAELARETGGAFFENSNDLLKGIERAFNDDHEQYVLAYVSSNSELDGKFRRLKVEVTRKGLNVLAKRGYWAIQ